MAKTRKTYTAEFKLQAVRMVTDQHLVRRRGRPPARRHRGPPARLAQGLPHQGLDAFPGHGDPPPRTRNCTASAPR